MSQIIEILKWGTDLQLVRGTVPTNPLEYLILTVSFMDFGRIDF